jgi:hypothetical protein
MHCLQFMDKHHFTLSRTPTFSFLLSLDSDLNSSYMAGVLFSFNMTDRSLRFILLYTSGGRNMHLINLQYPRGQFVEESIE